MVVTNMAAIKSVFRNSVSHFFVSSLYELSDRIVSCDYVFVLNLLSFQNAQNMYSEACTEKHSPNRSTAG